jgi:exopolysaccharide biosynthesis polyprenyl glycosylphosphotransferase
MLTLVFADIIIVTTSFSMAIMCNRFLRGVDITWTNSRVLFVVISLSFLVILFYYIFGLYDTNALTRKYLLLFTISISLIFIIVILSLFLFFILNLRASRDTYILFYFLAIFMTFACRLVYRKLISMELVNILIFGNDNIIKDLKRIIYNKYSQSYSILNLIDDENINTEFVDLYNLINNNNISLIIYRPQLSKSKEFASFLLDLRLQKISVYSSSDFYQRLTGKIPLYHLDDYWMSKTNQQEFSFPKITNSLKRLFDLAICLMVMPVALLLILVCAVAIKLTSRGPVFFIQERLGKDELPFRLLKLRTMVADAEKFTGPQWASENDLRITKVGRVLRKMRFDELPQIFNVLRGEMSIIGPRPIRHHFAKLLSQEIPQYRLRFLLKPGLTGWAQVSHDYAGSKEGQKEKLQYELFYLVHQSLLLDLLILLKTVKIMVLGKGN